MHRAMMATAEQDQIAEVRFPALGPMLDVMPICEAARTPWKAAYAIAEIERPAKRR